MTAPTQPAKPRSSKPTVESPGVKQLTKTGAGAASKVPKRKLGRPPAVKAHDTRRRILDCARAVYADLGYEVATNQDVAQAVGITTAALYYHFPSKRELYLEVHEDARRQVYSRFEEVLDTDDSFADQFLAVLEASHQLNDEDPTLARFLGAARVDMRRRPELIEAAQHRVAYRRQFFDGIVDAGIRSGEIRPEQRAIVSAYIMTVLTGMTDQMSDDQVLHRQAIDAVRAVLDGNLVRRPQPRRVRAG